MKIVRWILAAALFAGMGGAYADSVYVGVSSIQIHSSAADLSGYNTPPGLNLSIGNATTVALGIFHDLSGPWSVELFLGTPPKLDATAKGPGWALAGLSDGTKIASASIVSPTVFVNYYPLGKSRTWTPFVGLGLNYSHFQDLSSTQALNSHLGPTSLSLSDSWGPAAHIGMTMKIDRHWSILGSVAVAWVRSNLVVTAHSPVSPSTVTTQGSTQVDFHPTVYTLALMRSF